MYSYWQYISYKQKPFLILIVKDIKGIALGGKNMKKLIVGISIFFVTSFLIGCAKENISLSDKTNTTIESSQVNSNDITSKEVSKDITSQGFIEYIQNQGGKIKASEQSENNILKGKLTVLNINGKNIGVFEYKDNQEMEEDAKTIVGSSFIGNTYYEWVEPPLFFKGGNIIVMYVGYDEENLEIIKKFMGRPFAA